MISAPPTSPPAARARRSCRSFIARWSLAGGMKGEVALLNIGGVANVTYVADGEEPIACDTGPGNALIDDLMLQRTGAPIDRHGHMAARGRVNEAALLQDARRIPSSISRRRNRWTATPSRSTPSRSSRPRTPPRR